MFPSVVIINLVGNVSFNCNLVQSYLMSSKNCTHFSHSFPKVKAVECILYWVKLLNPGPLSRLLTIRIKKNNTFARMGLCLSLNECYPYFKIFELSWRDTWVMGHYDTCSYRSPQGSQVGRRSGQGRPEHRRSCNGNIIVIRSCTVRIKAYGHVLYLIMLCGQVLFLLELYGHTVMYRPVLIEL